MIVNPGLADTERTELVSTIESELADAGAKVLEANHPGERELAYRIHGSTSGYYLLYTLESEGKGGFFTVSNSFNIKKDIWRYQFIKLED